MQSLTSLPDNLKKLQGLTELNLGSCKSLQALPDSIGELKSLTRLGLGSCELLQALPASIGELKSLTALYLGGPHDAVPSAMPSARGAPGRPAAAREGWNIEDHPRVSV